MKIVLETSVVIKSVQMPIGNRPLSLPFWAKISFNGSGIKMIDLRGRGGGNCSCFLQVAE
jgi:hypothetical protein